MSDVSAYIPQDRRRALLRGEELPDRVSGTALLADVSGFTPLAEGLAAALGRRRGAEELTNLLNAVFDALIAPVEAFGGSVVGFAGDAITCWFDATPAQGPAAEPAALARAAGCALACARALQRAMEPFAAVPLPGGGQAALAIKVALVAGTARRFLVGDPAIQLLDVLAGRLLDQLGAVAALAAPGEVLVDEATLALLGPAAAAATWRALPAAGLSAAVVRAVAGPAPPPGLPGPAAALPDALAHPWVLPAVRERLRAGGDALLAELRPASVLMLQFGGLDYDTESDAPARLDSFLRAVQRALARGEGALLDVMMADQGGYLYAVFGAPVAHEDDPRRAVRAALALCAAPPAGLRLRAGVSQGLLRVGPYGGSSRRAYGALGDAANLAHRLMSRAAPGEVLVSGEAQAALAGLFRWEALPPLALKGKRAPVAVFRALGARERPPAPPRPEPGAMVGRAGERAALAAALERLAGGEGGTLLLEGEPGMGKSRLVAELRAQAAARGLEPLEGGGDAIEQATPYFAWRPLVRARLGLAADAAAPTDAAALAERFGPRAPLLNDVLGLRLPESELTAQLSGQARADNTNALLLALLAEAARARPLLIVMEDLHWLDSASGALLLLVQRRLPQALLVATTRPAVRPSSEDELLRAGPQTRLLRLGALSGAETLALACRQLGVTRLAPAVAQLLEARVEGNPFFGTELVAALQEAGLIVVEGAEGRAAPGVALEALALPATVQGVIASRVDRLRPEQQRVLKVASVIGRAFAYRTLRDIHPVPEERPAVAGRLEELRQLELTQLEQPAPELSYQFKHVLTQEATYDLLLYAQRRALHAAVARWYERRVGGPDGRGLAPYYGLLAHHWGRAEQPERTRHYRELAGEQALRAGAYREAAACLREALGLGADEPALRRARRHRLYGEALMGLGDLVTSQGQLEQVLDLVGDPIRSRDLASLARRSAGAALRLGAAHFAPRRAAGSPDPASLEAARAYLALGIIYTYASEGLAALYTALRAALILDPAGPREELQRALAGMGLAAGLGGLPPLARHYFGRALAEVRADGEAGTRAFVLQAASIYALGVCDWAAAADHLHEAVQLAMGRGDWRLAGELLNFVGQLHLSRGEFQQLLEVAARLQQLVERTENPVHRVWVMNLTGLALVRLGRPAEALSYLEGARRDLQDRGRVGTTICVTAYGLVGAYLAQGRVDRAAAAAADAAERVGWPFPVIYLDILGYIALAEAALARWRAAPSDAALRREALDACQDLLRQSWIFPIGRPAAWLCLGHAARLAGQPLVARALWRRSVASARRYGMPYEEALAHLELGRAATGDLRRRHLGHAIALFARLGAAGDLERAVAEARGGG